jgi:hypothetical protein
VRRLLAAVCALAAVAWPSAASADLPVVRIDASRAIPNEPKVGARLHMRGYRGRIRIETRGQSSQAFPKK